MFAKHFKLDICFVNLNVELLVFKVTCHNDLKQLLPFCRHSVSIFSCVKTSSDYKLWSGNLCSTQGRDLIVTPREQEVADFPFASPNSAPFGCKELFPSPQGPFTLTFLSWPFDWDKGKSCYLKIYENKESGSKHGVNFSLARDLSWLWAGHFILSQLHKW